MDKLEGVNDYISNAPVKSCQRIYNVFVKIFNGLYEDDDYKTVLSDFVKNKENFFKGKKYKLSYKIITSVTKSINEVSSAKKVLNNLDSLKQELKNAKDAETKGEQE